MIEPCSDDLINTENAPGKASFSARSLLSDILSLNQTKAARPIVDDTAPANLETKDGVPLLGQEAHLHQLKGFLPKFLGTLTVQGTDDGPLDGAAKQEVEALQAEDGKPKEVNPFSLYPFLQLRYFPNIMLYTTYISQCIVLQDLAYPYTRPSILDIKLGRLTHDETATPEKAERMLARAKSTTSWHTGMRLTGFQTWDPVNTEAVVTPKEYGYSIAADQLIEGMGKFFKTDWVAKKELDVMDQDSAEKPAAIASSVFSLIQRQQYRRNLIRTINSLISTLDKLITLFSVLEIRMIGASILILYEGDPTLLEEAWRLVDDGKARGDGLDDEDILGYEESDGSDNSEDDHVVVELEGNEEDINRLLASSDSNVGQSLTPAVREQLRKTIPDPTAVWTDSRYNGFISRSDSPALQKLKRNRRQSGENDNDNDNDDDEDEDEDEERIPLEDEEERKPRPFTFRMIDFAHTRLAQGEGPDEGLLTGMKSLRELLYTRKEEIRQEVATA